MLFCVTSDKQIRAHFKYCQIKIHVQLALESHDLNMDFISFDNGFIQLCVMNFMQESILTYNYCLYLFSVNITINGFSGQVNHTSSCNADVISVTILYVRNSQCSRISIRVTISWLNISMPQPICSFIELY